MSQTKVALFPIPNCVSFPGTIYPLHVFEPRYRTMVKYCLETGTYMAVCHTQKELSPAKPNQSSQDALHSNQATYKPYDVFSAGVCELVEELPDGRMLIHVHLEARFKAVSEVQTLPFRVFLCETVEDEPISVDAGPVLEQLKDKVLHRLLALAANDALARDILSSDEWQQKSAQAFSFEVFGLVQLDPELQQEILEYRSPVQRLETLLGLLNEAR